MTSFLFSQTECLIFTGTQRGNYVLIALGMERDQCFVNVFPNRITTRDIVKPSLPLLLRQFRTSVSLKHVIRPCSTSELVFGNETNERVALP